MKILNKFFIALLLLSINNTAFSQLQKGDVWLDFSPQQYQLNSESKFIGNFEFISNSSFFQTRMGYGKFINNNTLLGFRVNSLGTIDRDLFFFEDHSIEINVGLFVKRYFGQKQVRLFAETSLNTELYSGLSLFNSFGLRTTEYLNWKVGGGLAYFINERTSLEFSYHLKPFALGLNGRQIFPDKFAPDFGIGLRYFILKNRAGIQNLNASKSLEKGTLSVDFNSNFFISRIHRSKQSKLSIGYFVRDDFQLKVEFGLENNNFKFGMDDPANGQMSRVISDIKNNYFGGLHGLYTFRLNKTLALDAGLGFKLIRNPNINQNQFGVFEEESKFFKEELSIRTGLSLYLGRHLLRPYFLYQQRSYDSNASRTELISFNGFSFHLDYELFLAENLSMNMGVNYSPDYQWVEPNSNIFINNGSLFTEETNNVFRANFGFKWYLRRG